MLGAGAALLGIAALVWPQREHALRGMPSLVATYQNEAELPLRPLKGLEFAASEMNLPAKDSSATPAVPHPARETPTLTESPSKLAQRARTSVKGAPPAIAENTLALEARLLGRARKALPLAPDEALLLTERHRARFPDGVLVEEREAIAIRAMHQAGMLEGARARHVQFLARFPASPHARNLDALANASRVSR